MKKLLLAGLAGLVLVDVANAADIGVRPVPSSVIAPAPYFSWMGPYVGAIVGGGWVNTETEYSYTSDPTKNFERMFGPGPPIVGPLSMPGTSAVASAISHGFLPTSFGKKATGNFTAGGLVGFNFQMAQIVFGLEADFAWMSGARTNQFAAQVPVPNTVTTLTNTTTEKDGLQWLSTVRGRAGYAINRALIFATGGVAIARVTATTNEILSDGTNTDVFAGNATFGGGYVVGGGIEYALMDYLTVKVEYLYYNLDTVKYSVTAANPVGVGQGLGINASEKFNGNIFRVGLNFKPDWL